MTEWIDKASYPTFEDSWDSKIFQVMIGKRLRDHMHVLDFGAGRGSNGGAGEEVSEDVE